MFLFYLWCYSDAMETDEKAGSSPAGKAAETVSILGHLAIVFFCLNSENCYTDSPPGLFLEGRTKRPERQNDQNP